ncbi:hypothetical protein [Sporohalobacter salinus]|uniref:hypothetical protein n=1 Tax=Sporohalobacter salinus TaxID=1494606 RepID=UPI0019609FFB|nr:hypothetical protein [Sporohalobacter salinus]MBM7623403.1 hypothetical protein [Sporohalobacter salinus]
MKKSINLSQEDIRLNYLSKLNFAKNLLLDLLPSDEEVETDMQDLYSTLKKLINLLQEIKQDKHEDFSQVYQLIVENEFLDFIYFAKEEEIYLTIKEKFDLDPEYQWNLFNRIYAKLEEVSQKINYLSEIESSDASEIQKLLMEIAIIFNTNLTTEAKENKYLVRHLNGVYHYIRGDFNESLHTKGNLAIEGDLLQRAKNEYKQALKFDKSLVKARNRLRQMEKSIV